MTSFSCFINQSVFSLSVGKSYLKAGSFQSLSVQMSSLASALRIFQRMAEEKTHSPRGNCGIETGQEM